MFSITCIAINIEKAVQLQSCRAMSHPVCRLCFCWAETCLCVYERHLSVAYVGDANLEDAEVTKICEASYQLVDLRPETLLTDANWQVCLTQPTNRAAQAIKPIIA